MQDTELFLSLAEIAGVFVGFGALIAVRSGGPTEASEVTGIRWVMSNAIWVVIAALIPILVSGYGVSSHELWLLCSLLALVLLAVMIVVNGRAPENLAEIAAKRVATKPAMWAVVYLPTIWLPLVLLVLALALVVVGPSRPRSRRSTSPRSGSACTWARWPCSGWSSSSDLRSRRPTRRSGLHQEVRAPDPAWSPPASPATGDRSAHATDASGQRAWVVRLSTARRVAPILTPITKCGGDGTSRTRSCSFRWPRSPASSSASGRSSPSGAAARATPSTWRTSGWWCGWGSRWSPPPSSRSPSAASTCRATPSGCPAASSCSRCSSSATRWCCGCPGSGRRSWQPRRRRPA